MRELQTKSRDLRERKKRLLQRREMLVRRIKSLRGKFHFRQSNISILYICLATIGK